MKKYLTILLISMLLIFNIYNFTYATEEDGRFVDIPVPPASSGRTDFTSEEGQEQAKEYEEAKNTEQTNSEVLEENFILYKGTEEIVGNTINENNVTQNQKLQNNENIENDNITINEKNVKANNRLIIICGIIIMITIMFLIIKNKKSKWKINNFYIEKGKCDKNERKNIVNITML